jgi:hypothetical protein
MPDMNKKKSIGSVAARINALAQRFQSAKYLEIGVSRGKTFFSVNLPLKIAVDPRFRFDPKEHSEDGALYFPVTSDEFFAAFPGTPEASRYFEPDGRLTFDIIYIDGLHTFEQSLRDFENSRNFCHQNTIWIMDDTVPSDVFSSIPDQALALESRKLAGGTGGAWHGDVFKTLLAIHDFHPDISYCTVMGPGNPQTVLWQAPPLPERKPRFTSPQEIARLGYLAVLEHADLFLPVDDDTSGNALIGKSLVPALRAHEDTWKIMLYSRLVTAEEVKLRAKVAELTKRYNRLKSSLSWKMTAPVRLLGRLARKVIDSCCIIIF